VNDLELQFKQNPRIGSPTKLAEVPAKASFVQLVAPRGHRKKVARERLAFGLPSRAQTYGAKGALVMFPWVRHGLEVQGRGHRG